MSTSKESKKARKVKAENLNLKVDLNSPTAAKPSPNAKKGASPKGELRELREKVQVASSALRALSMFLET